MKTPFLLLSIVSSIPFTFAIPLVWYVLLSMITVAVFAHDKRAARRQRRRVPEKRLHLLELIGGFPGAWIAITLFHHKSRKPSFLFMSVLCTLVNVAVAFLLILLLSTTAASDGS